MMAVRMREAEKASGMPLTENQSINHSGLIEVWEHINHYISSKIYMLSHDIMLVYEPTQSFIRKRHTSIVIVCVRYILMFKTAFK